MSERTPWIYWYIVAQNTAIFLHSEVLVISLKSIFKMKALIHIKLTESRPVSQQNLIWFKVIKYTAPLQS